MTKFRRTGTSRFCKCIADFHPNLRIVAVSEQHARLVLIIVEDELALQIVITFNFTIFIIGSSKSLYGVLTSHFDKHEARFVGSIL